MGYRCRVCHEESLTTDIEHAPECHVPEVLAYLNSPGTRYSSRLQASCRCWSQEARSMKQYETKARALLSDSSAIIMEGSNIPARKNPVLTIQTAWRPSSHADVASEPPMSIKLGGTETRALYEFLREYYQTA
jgi:hypothetical protein